MIIILRILHIPTILNVKLSESLAGKYCLRNQKELDIRLFSAISVGVGPVFKTLTTVYIRCQSYK